MLKSTRGATQHSSKSAQQRRGLYHDRSSTRVSAFPFLNLLSPKQQAPAAASAAAPPAPAAPVNWPTPAKPTGPASLTPAEGLPTYGLATVPTNLETTIALSERHRMLLSYFPTALGVDDFIGRIEVALCGFGFTGENSIAMTNLCRDEVTSVVKDKIEEVFGSSFNTNGLGAVLTCGVTGIKAGLSHAPVQGVHGRERYVFFSFPHIAIDSTGAVGSIQRPGRPQNSCACGALAACLNLLKTEGVAASCKTPGVHDPLDPEFTILKQRLARRVRYEKLDMAEMDLCGLTHVAERTITDDLEYLISKAVDTKKADYAVVCGVQIHNWAKDMTEGGEASLEFLAPSKVYVCVNGVKTSLEMSQIPPLTPRQIMLLAQARSGNSGSPDSPAPASAITYTGSRSSTVQGVPFSYLTRRLGGVPVTGSGANSPRGLPLNPKPSTPPKGASSPLLTANGPACEWPSWQSKIRGGHGGTGLDEWIERDLKAPTMESPEEPHANTSFVV